MQMRTRDDGAVEVTVSSKPSKRKSSISRVEIEPAENGGASVRCCYRHEPEGKSNMLAYEEPKIMAFSSMPEALAEVAKLLGDAKDED